MATNPFTLGEILTDQAFCDREKQLNDFLSFADSKTNAVLFSPRRFGKTSLMKRVQHQLRGKGYLTSYCDLFGVTSIEEIAGRITKSLFEITHRRKRLFKKAISFLTSFRPVMGVNDRGEIIVSVQPAFKRVGLDTLDETMKGLTEFIEKIDHPVHIVLDEFQELNEIDDSIAVEGILRSNIQHIPCAFVFVGSRRRLLLDMFNDRKRPFFQSAVNYELGPLPGEDSIEYIISQFSTGKKQVTADQASQIVKIVSHHPGYVQKLCFFLFNLCEKKVTRSDITKAYERLLLNEKPYFESIIQGLSTKQTALLLAIAKEPDGKIYSTDYMSRHNLGSTGGIQNSLSVLLRRDIIEQNPETKNWSNVDPVFKNWLLDLSI